MADIYGISGLFLISAGWLFELWGIFKNKKSQVPLNFAVLYGAGSALLTMHSILLSDKIFIALNGFATMIALVNIGFNLFERISGKKAAKSNARKGRRHV
jgi:lipid-A-disaccharide synthase-like uncharacterized protein